MSKDRNQRRQEKGERSVNVYPPDTSLGWRVIYMVSALKAAERLAAGVWREVYDEYGSFWGCQVVANFGKDEAILSGASSTSITVSELELNAGLRGKSRTVGLSEEQRIARINGKGKPLPPEDAIERAQAKVKQWPYPASRIDDGRGEPKYGDRAVRVYPKAAEFGV
jgi:hypothetical protein